MLISTILNSKDTPSKIAKLLIIYSEGEKREKDYIYFFKKRSSQIKLEVETVPKKGVDGSDGNNSPTGLFSLATSQLLSSEGDSENKYELDELDEVWFLIDTDKWGDKIDELYASANSNDWNVVQSNPCFEVWLYYHKFNELPSFENFEDSVIWKDELNTLIPGGFDSRKHPIEIKSAIDNSIKNYQEIKNQPIPGCTSVHILGQNLYDIIKDKL